MKTKKSKKILNIILVSILCIGILKIDALAYTQEITKGYYDDNNIWKEGTLEQSIPEGIKVDKTAEKLDKNRYKINLKVITEKKKDFVVNKSATVLLLDTSGSMIARNRLENAKKAAKKFINSYGGDENREGRYLSIVKFNKDAKIVLNWIDVGNKNGKEKAYSVIDNLNAIGGTNLQSGIKESENLFDEEIVKDIKSKDTIILTDGTPTYYIDRYNNILGNGYMGSKKIIEETTKEAKLLQEKSSIYTICYGVENNYTYRDYWSDDIENGPTIGDFLTNYIASKPERAYNADNANQLNDAFDDITTEIISGIDGKELKVVDKSTEFVKINTKLPDSVILDNENNFIWNLDKTEPLIEDENKKTVYTYEITYEVLVDIDNTNLKGNKYYPLNGDTYVMVGNQKVKFPIPAIKVEKKYVQPIISNNQNENNNYQQENIDKRIEGNDRIDTSIDASKVLYPNGTDSVVLANCERYTDVLTANPFAVQIKASSLFTYKDKLPEKTLKEIERLGAKKIYISGGYEAVSKKVVDRLSNMGYSIHRFDGKDRYDTARKIAIKIREKGNKNIVELASGENYPDALSMTSMAVKDNAPILLTKKDLIPMYTKKALAQWDIETIKIAGLNEAISKDVENQIHKGFSIIKGNKENSNVYNGAKILLRYGGKDRYETSTVIAEESYPESKLGVYATGEDFPDALIAGNYAGRKEAPVLLVKRDTLPKVVENYTKESKIKRATLIGGVNAISDKVLYDIKNIIELNLY
ncbi:cell wall-binding repeat-containing protein [Peptacetobacter sp.]|uniref:cell wall-binding repeat-containing protein n=1 Tax=Peptacetobacter sp. TaxID=2991975 RepID=UPI00260B6137|nr:cell wall-binding repeat-containing protein [Peptacetobacter sp.]